MLILLVMSYIAVDCGALPEVQNGRAATSETVFQSVANYSCDNGYNLVGVPSRTCESNAVWSGAEPECKGIQLQSFDSFLQQLASLFLTT